MPTIQLVRHGESQSNQARRFTGQLDSGLTALGRAQAEAAARVLAGCGAERLVVSNLRRARQTADPIAAALQLPPETVPDLGERNFGHWENHTMEEIAALWPDEHAIIEKIDFDFRPEGGESIHDLYDRSVAWFRRQLEPLPDDAVVVMVSHGGNILCILKHAMNLPYNHRVSLALDNGGITTLDRDHRGGWRVVCLNRTQHLAGLECEGNRKFL